MGTVPALLPPPSFERLAVESFASYKLFWLSAGSAVIANEEGRIKALCISSVFASKQGREEEGAAGGSRVSWSSQLHRGHSSEPVWFMWHKLVLGLLLLAVQCLFVLSSGNKVHCYFYLYCVVFSGVLGAVRSDQ